VPAPTVKTVSRAGRVAERQSAHASAFRLGWRWQAYPCGLQAFSCIFWIDCLLMSPRVFEAFVSPTAHALAYWVLFDDHVHACYPARRLAAVTDGRRTSDEQKQNTARQVLQDFRQYRPAFSFARLKSQPAGYTRTQGPRRRITGLMLPGRLLPSGQSYWDSLDSWLRAYRPGCGLAR
jgi:hypothetical protein